MITLQEFCHYLESLFALTPIRDYCPNGIQVEGQNKIFKVGTAVSASLSTIQEAANRGVQALIVHHGIFWEKEDFLVVGTRKEKLKLLLDHGISLFAYHLPLDMHPLIGNNWKAAIDLGWEELLPFGKYNGTYIGVRGKLKKKMTREDFKMDLERYYDHPAHVAFGGKELVQSVALISGGAHKSIKEAIDVDVDCFITGSFDEPIWNIAQEEKINFYAMGHSATEKVGPKALGELLAKHFSIEHEFLDLPNPF